MNQHDANTDQVQTGSLEDLKPTNEQAEETKAGSAGGSGKMETYLELKLTNTLISGY